MTVKELKEELKRLKKIHPNLDELWVQAGMQWSYDDATSVMVSSRNGKQELWIGS